MITELQNQVKKILQSLIKFFTNPSLTINDWQWVKGENEEAKLATKREDGLDDVIEIYNYYPLKYYTSLKSLNGK